MKNILETVVYAGIFAIPFIVLLVTESLFFPFVTGKNFTFRVLVEIMFVAWAVLALYDVRFRPRFSWILGFFGALVAVMLFANIFGAYPLKSFWSNFERMEGYVTLVHVFLYFMVVASVLRVEMQRWLSQLVSWFVAVLGVFFIFGTFSTLPAQTLWGFPMGLITLIMPVVFGLLVYQIHKATNSWDRFWNATLSVAVLLGWYAFAQFLGAISISQGAGWRIDGTLGNSTYMAVYALFHIFIAAILFQRAHTWLFRSLYGTLALTYVFILVQTGTRGAILGLAGGVLLAVAYIALFAKGQVVVRRIALGGLLVALLTVGLFVTFRDSTFVQSDPRLSRIASITLEEGQTRFTIWSMAFEGVLERPILGWGQGNFDYVFNKHYRPELYGQEPWFDRVHNIVLDWLVAGGFVGALCYFGIFGAALWYLIIQPLRRPDEVALSVTERGIILGLLGGYVFHNLFVFDNIVSYIFFATIIAYVHAATATSVARVEGYRVPEYQITNIYAPVAGVVLLASLYMVNVPNIKAAGDVIDALSSQHSTERLAAFNRALDRNSFANQEIREQLMLQALREFRLPNVTADLKQQWFTRAEAELLQQVEDKPGDTRGLLLTSTFYRATGNSSASEEKLKTARSTSPKKQQIIFEQGFVALQQDKFQEGFNFFKEAYELAPDYPQARIFYALASLYVDGEPMLDELLDTEELRAAFAKNDVVMQALYQTGKFDLLEEMLKLRISLEPAVAEMRVNLAALYFERGNATAAIEVLTQAISEIPEFKEQGEQLIAQVRSGGSPQTLDAVTP